MQQLKKSSKFNKLHLPEYISDDSLSSSTFFNFWLNSALNDSNNARSSFFE